MFSPLIMVATVNVMTAPEICLLHCDLLCGYKLSENFTTIWSDRHGLSENFAIYWPQCVWKLHHIWLLNSLNQINSTIILIYLW